jgi:DNA invertase Pin-like site-specific DNA recombinase
MTKAIIYVRVSTAKQGRSGLGLEDQTNKCLSFCKEREMEVLDIYCDADVSGKIDPDQRPALSQALQQAKLEGAKIIVKSLCRLSREVYHVSGLMRHQVDFVVCDHPNAPSFLLHILASMNQFEREQISKRTKDALAVAKKRGVKLGTHIPSVREAHLRRGRSTFMKLYPHIQQAGSDLENEGKKATTRAIANLLNEREVPTPSGKGKWQSAQITRLLARAKKHLGE